MNCAEFIGILKSGQPIILRRNSKEYLRLSENTLQVVTGAGQHLTLWLAANRKFKRILRSAFRSPYPPHGQGLPRLADFSELRSFLRKWEEIREARNWGNTNFPDLREIAAFAYLTLIPEYWIIYLEVEGKSVEEILPLVEHESLHSDMDGYDY